MNRNNGQAQLNSKSLAGGQMPAREKGHSREAFARYGALILLLVLIGGFHTLYTLHVIRNRVYATTTVRTPFNYDADQRITSTTAEAESAGVHKGDVVEEVRGQRFTGTQILECAVEQAQPSSRLNLVVRHPDGTRSGVQIILRGRRAAEHLSVPILIEIVVPLFSLLLAFWVTALRPYDSRAWVLLGLLASFSLLVVETGWHGPFRTFAAVYESIVPESFGIWLIFFGIYFPGKIQITRRYHILKWALVAAIGLNILLDAIAVVSEETNFSMAAVLRHHYEQLQNSINLLVLVSLLVCVASLIFKLRRTAPETDAY